MLLATAAVDVASVLPTDEADAHFATLADGAVLVIGVTLLCIRRLPLIARVAGAITAGICAAFLIYRIANGIA